MRCPVCRADNSEGPLCRRCRADLSTLFALEAHRAAALAAAAADAPLSLRHAETAHALRRGPDSWRALAVARLRNRDFAAALIAYNEARETVPPR
jgi:hypothetical protein